MLTGQAKIDFEKWLGNQKWFNIYMELEFENTYLNEELFYKYLPFSMQYGVYVDWFDSVGIHILEGYYPFLFGGHTYAFSIREKSKKYSIDESFNSRYESRTEAIKNANEIYNSIK